MPGTILGHEFVGIVEQTGEAVRRFKPGDRVAVNVETFCGECYFCKRGYVNNCTMRRRVGAGVRGLTAVRPGMSGFHLLTTD